jgi:hypothetical protein
LVVKSEYQIAITRTKPMKSIAAVAPQVSYTALYFILLFKYIDGIQYVVQIKMFKQMLQILFGKQTSRYINYLQ